MATESCITKSFRNFLAKSGVAMQNLRKACGSPHTCHRQKEFQACEKKINCTGLE